MSLIQMNKGMKGVLFWDLGKLLGEDVGWDLGQVGAMDGHPIQTGMGRSKRVEGMGVGMGMRSGVGVEEVRPGTWTPEVTRGPTPNGPRSPPPAGWQAPKIHVGICSPHCL